MVCMSPHLKNINASRAQGITSAYYGMMLQGAEHFLPNFLWHNFWEHKARYQPTAGFRKISHVFVRFFASDAET